MRAGHVDAVSREAVAGWAAESDRPDEPISITINVNGRKIAEVTADRHRRDLEASGKWGDGRHGFRFTFPEKLAVAEDSLVVIRFRDDGRLVPNGQHMLYADATDLVPEGGLAPILVTAPGRSGTTLLMSLLAANPEIVAGELVPYELRLLSYYAALHAVLDAPADWDRSTHPDHLEGDGFHIGFNPFRGPHFAAVFRNQATLADYHEKFVPEQVAGMIRTLLQEYYGRLAADKGKDAVRYFAEKNNNLHRPTRMAARRVFGRIREVVIVRDPRDVLCSHVAYFESPPEKAFQQLSHACRQLLAIRREARSDLVMIHYEAMLRGMPEFFEALSGFLGVRIDPPDPDRQKAQFARHGTSETPEATIGRWRTHLAPELAERCAAEWGEFLTTFGYA